MIDGRLEGLAYQQINITIGKYIHARHEQVAQGQYVISDARCPALHDCELE